MWIVNSWVFYTQGKAKTPTVPVKRVLLYLNEKLLKTEQYRLKTKVLQSFNVFCKFRVSHLHNLNCLFFDL
jgi:hypothetical protein